MSRDLSNMRLGTLLHHLGASFLVFHRFPVLLPAALLMLVDEMNYSGINNVAISAYLNGLPAAVMAPEAKKLLIGGMASTFLLAETLFRLPSGWLSDHFGRARIVTLAVLLTAPSFLLAALAPRWSWLFPLRAWDGIMAAAIFTSVYAIIGDAVPERFRANAMGVINASYMFGLLAGYAVAGTVDSLTKQPRLFLLISTAVAVCAGLLAWLFFRARPELNAPHPEVHREEAGKSGVDFSHHLILLLITFTQNLALTILAPYMYLYAVKKELIAQGGLGLSFSELGILIGGPLLGVAFFAIPLSRLADRIGTYTAVRLAFTVVAATLWVFAVTKSLWLLATAALFVGIAFSMGVPAWLAILSSLAGSKTRGMTLGGYGTVQGVAAVIGPLAGALVWRRFGLPHLFTASAVLVGIASILAWTALPQRPADTAAVASSSR